MNIKLLVSQNEGKQPNLVTKYTLVETIREANRVEEESIDENTYSLIKALSKNNDFISMVKNLRSKYEIPENGFSIKEWNLRKGKMTQSVSYFKWRSKVELESIREITKYFKIHPLLVTSLPDIVSLGCVRIPIKKIFVEAPHLNRPRYSPSAVKIVISSKVSKYKLLEFINSNWVEIEGGLKNTDGLELTISDRSLRIIEERDSLGKKFLKIADDLRKEIDDPDIKINEDSTKEAYHKAKKRIKSLKR